VLGVGAHLICVDPCASQLALLLQHHNIMALTAQLTRSNQA
jgi:hypothetical protein